MKFDNSRILVTGASGGIGSALCRLLVDEGARLVLVDHDPDRLARLSEEIGSAHECVPADITTEAGRRRIAESCRHDGLDALVNLAGILDFHLFDQQPPELLERMLAVNLLAPILLCRELLPLLRERESATILNVGSVFGSIGHPGFVAYCASKAGLKGFSEALARELADSRVQVCYIAPRATATALNSDRVNQMNEALGNRADPPELVAREIAALLRKGGGTRYLGWPEKLFVRLNALLPGLVHRALVKNLEIIKHYANP